MVSFFGLRIGGEKKKKNDKAAAAVPPPKSKTFDPAVLGDEKEREKALAQHGEGSTADTLRPGSSKSWRCQKRRPTDLPFGFDSTALSAIGLPSPHKFNDSSYPVLGCQSNGSAPNLLPPRGFEPITRPSTSSRDKPRFEYFDAPIAREASPILVASPKSISADPKSPLEKLGLKLSEGTALVEDDAGVLRPPEPLRIIKKPSIPELVTESADAPGDKPPSPPQSIRTDEMDRSGATLKLDSLADIRRKLRMSDDSQRAISADLDDEFRELSEELNYGPKAIPSPPASVHHGAEEARRGPVLEEFGVPVIQTVEAKRNTLTINSPGGTSTEMRMERSGTPQSLNLAMGPELPTKSNARRPPALNLNLQPAAADLNGPRSAPFPGSRPPWTPLAPSPLAAPPSSRIMPFRNTSEDSIDWEPPHSPESPVLPLSGPLASRQGSPVAAPVAPRQKPLPPIRRNTDPEEDPEERIRNFRFPIPAPEKTAATSPSSPQAAQPFPSFTPLTRAPTLPEDDANWPLPSPTARTKAPADAFPPLEPPRMPAAFAESTTMRTRSFSRPWTPTNEPLRFEITSPHADTIVSSASASICSPRGATTKRTAQQSPRVVAPPPRSPPVAGSGVDRGLRSPGIVGDDFGGGFI